MLKYIAVFGVALGLAACSGGGTLPSAGDRQVASSSTVRKTSTIARDATVCTPVTTSKGSMTAAIVATPGEVVNSSAPANYDVDATGCDIGIYIPAGSNNVVITYSTVHDANQYGIFNDAASGADVENNTVSMIGNHNGSAFAPNGVQTGLGILESGGDGKYISNVVNNYQKNGMTFVNHALVSVQRNTVTGLGHVNYIAQNGIEVYESHPYALSGNTVTKNYYTGATYTATGFLIYRYAGPTAAQIKASNSAHYNQTNFYIVK